MKIKLLSIIICLFFLQNIMAQTDSKPANPADVASVDAIMKAVYDVISGDAGQTRDWDRFRTLFHKDARLIPTGKNPNTNVFGATVLTPEDYIKRADPVLVRDGFHEREIARKQDTYGNIVQAFSTYEARRKQTDEKPFLRGINSFQLLFDGSRWWVMTIYWQAETPDNPIPKQYERSQVEYFPSAGTSPYSESVRVGNLLYVSGQIGTDASGKLVTGGISAETKQILDKIKATLEKRGSSMNDVVKCVVMLTDIKEWAEMNKVYATYFTKNLPARSSLGVNGLVLGAKVEIECIATVR